MESSVELDITTQRNVDEWLHGNYDSETKEEVHKLLRKNPKDRAVNRHSKGLRGNKIGRIGFAGRIGFKRQKTGSFNFFVRYK